MAETLSAAGWIIKQNTNFNRPFFFGTISQTVSVSISKNNGAFAGAAGTVSEVGGAGNGNGWYNVSYTIVDTNTAGLLTAHATASSGGPADFQDFIQAQVFTDVPLDANGNVGVTSNIKKNTARPGFMFFMTLTGTNNPGIGLTVSGFRSFDRGSFNALSNSPGGITEIANGWYGVDLTAADTNGNNVAYRFTATGANDTNMSFWTQP